MSHATARAPQTAAVLLAALWLGACASKALPPDAGDPAPARLAPAQWQAPLPHNGDGADLSRWWQQFDDPLLVDLVMAAQAVSPDIASAASRIEQARATRVAAGAALGPTLDAGLAAQRGRQDLQTPVASGLTADLRAGWELDVFGGLGAGRDAAQARLDGAQAEWHDARVVVAAEVAASYTRLRACEAQLVQTRADAESRAETSRLTELTAKAGFQAPAFAALARASAAQGRSLVAAQQAQCAQAVKSLVALTGLDEPTLRLQLQPRTAVLPVPSSIGVNNVPAAVLAQRPDVFAAAREVTAAAADTAQTDAQRYPRVSLAGSVGAVGFRVGGESGTGNLWSIGPLQVSLPLFDGGTRVANVDAARARYDAAAASYRARLRGAVREVEEALVALQSTATRSEDAQVAADGFEVSLKATEARFNGGLGTLFELEDARRSALQARSALIDLQRERVDAWILLYRALGGGWSAPPAEPGAGATALRTP
jgi:multidrug efflux system outer membrane protein